MCDVLHCRKETDISILGVELCDDHWEQYSDEEPKSFNTSKGFLTHIGGAAVLSK